MLTLCPACSRHHLAEAACPFCARAPRAASPLVRRALSLAAGAVVLGTFGCAYGSPEPDCTDASTDPACRTADPTVGDGATDAGAPADGSPDAP